jgi:hypothetical protein
MAKKLSKTAQINAYIESNPTAPSGEVAKKFGVKSGYVSSLKWNLKKKGVAIPTNRAIKAQQQVLKGAEAVWKHISVTSSNTPIQGVNHNVPVQIEMFEPKADPVNHPAHYKAGGIETIDFIEAKKLGYNLGNVVKYITRADLKGNRKQDLEKALWYLKREIGAQ